MLSLFYDMLVAPLPPPLVNWFLSWWLNWETHVSEAKFVSGSKHVFDPRQKHDLVFAQHNVFPLHMFPARLNLETFASAKEVVYYQIDVQTSEKYGMITRDDYKRKSAKRCKKSSRLLRKSIYYYVHTWHFVFRYNVSSLSHRGRKTFCLLPANLATPET